jgi:hypothetical protein
MLNELKIRKHLKKMTINFVRQRIPKPTKLPNRHKQIPNNHINISKEKASTNNTNRKNTKPIKLFHRKKYKNSIYNYLKQKLFQFTTQMERLLKTKMENRRNIQIHKTRIKNEKYTPIYKEFCL